MQRSSTRTIIISLVIAVLFGAFVLWASLQVQILAVTWWDQKTNSQEFKDQAKQTQQVSVPADPDFVPPGNWDSSPPHSEELKKIIAQVEANEKLYKNLEVKSTSENISVRKEFSLEGEVWTTNRDNLFWNKFESLQKTENGGGTKSVLSSRPVRGFSADLVDPETFDKIEKSILDRLSLSRNRSQRHQIFQEGLSWSVSENLPFERYALGQDLPLPESGELLEVPTDLEPQITSTHVQKRFDSCDGEFNYTSTSQHEFRRRSLAESGAYEPAHAAQGLNLYSGGSRSMKHFHDLYKESKGMRRRYWQYSETRYSGDGIIDGEPVKIVSVSQFNSKGPKKLNFKLVLSLAVNKNYLPVKIERFQTNSQEPDSIKKITSWQEIEAGVWFPEKIVETGKVRHRIAMIGSGNAGPAAVPGDDQRMLIYKNITTYDVISLHPQHKPSQFSTVPGIAPEHLQFRQIAERFIESLMKGDEQAALELTDPETFDPSVLETVKLSLERGQTLELDNYELLGRLEQHDRSQSNWRQNEPKVFGIAAGIRYKAYNKTITAKPVGSLDLLLIQKNEGKWLIDTCVHNSSRGYEDLWSWKYSELNHPVFVKQNRPPAKAERVKQSIR